MWLLIVGAVFLVNNAINVQYAYSKVARHQQFTFGCCDDSAVLKRIDELEKRLLGAIGGATGTTTKIVTTPKSCNEILSSNPSAPTGEYTINSGLGDQKVFCQMQSLGGCSGGGWRRVASFDRRTGTNCPPGFTNFKRGEHFACQRSGPGCTSVKFYPGQSYKEVCGMVKGYRIGSCDSFKRFGTYYGDINNINSAYVDGVSITQGSPRRHLWSYACSHGSGSNVACPCTGRSQAGLPYFIKNNNYYCEGARGGGVQNVLWDGLGCSNYEKAGCCSNHPNMPWFHRNDITQSSDFIELRLCGDESLGNEKIPIFQYEFYVR